MTGSIAPLSFAARPAWNPERDVIPPGDGWRTIFLKTGARFSRPSAGTAALRT
jgi:hypothetical protein